jgi:hypothetical protein
MISGDVPAAYGTTIVTGRAGHPWAITTDGIIISVLIVNQYRNPENRMVYSLASFRVCLNVAGTALNVPRFAY